MKYFDDLKEGDKGSFGKYIVTREEIIEFAKKYDPQYFHIDEETAKHSIFGSLCASGWHTAAMTHRILVDYYFKDIAILGSPGGEMFKWRKPVFPNDQLSAETEIIKKTDHRKRPNVGIIKSKCKTLNQKKEVVMELIVDVLIEKRKEKL